MWPVILGIGALVAIINSLSEDDNDSTEEPKKLFISFAIEDKRYRDFLVAQSKNARSPFSFEDMSVKKPWEESEWKRQCRKKIRSCDGVIVLLSKKTWHSSGLRWEVKCAREEGVKIRGMHISKDYRGAIPPELQGIKIVDWNWENIDSFIRKL
jgi:hypothetical protein